MTTPERVRLDTHDTRVISVLERADILGVNRSVAKELVDAYLDPGRYPVTHEELLARWQREDDELAPPLDDPWPSDGDVSPFS